MDIHRRPNQFSLQRAAVQYHIYRMFVAFFFFHVKFHKLAANTLTITNGTNVRFFLSLCFSFSFFLTFYQLSIMSAV